MVRGLAFRRTHAELWQQKRKRRWSNVGGIFWTEWLENPVRYGMLKKHHFGCGCPMCKPWKHKVSSEPKYPFNTYRKPQFLTVAEEWIGYL